MGSNDKEKTERTVAVCVTIVVVICLLLWFPPGCGALETQAGKQLEDIDGWDLSFCVESSCGREACFEFFKDNADKFLNDEMSIETAIDDAIVEVSEVAGL